MAVRISWNGGGSASVETVEGDHIELVSSRPFAPGSRPEGTLEGAADRVWLKVHGARRQEDGTFHVRGRLLNMRREVLERLKNAVLAPNGGKNPAS